MVTQSQVQPASPSAPLIRAPLARRFADSLLGVLVLGVVILLWELAPQLGWINPAFTSSPTRILTAAVWLFEHGLWGDLAVSFAEFAIGFLLAILLGVPVGLALGWSDRLRAMFEPLVILLYTVPVVALFPLLMLWVGIGIESKIAVVFLGAVFPIVVNLIAGVRTVDPALVRCARCFGARPRQVLLTVGVPSAVPFMITGIRLGASRGLIGIIVGELIASSAGLGHMMSIAGATFQTDKVFVGVILLALFGLALSRSLQALEARVDAWRPRS